MSPAAVLLKETDASGIGNGSVDLRKCSDDEGKTAWRILLIVVVVMKGSFC